MKNINFKKNNTLSNISKYISILAVIFASFANPVTIFGATEENVIKNPLPGINDIPQFIEIIIKIVLTVGVPILVLAFIYAGFLYVKAQGNPGELEVAHRTLLYTVIGGALLLGAFIIANAIGSTVTQIGNGV